MSLLIDIRKRLDAFRLDVRLSAGDEAVALFGASGSGKSLTLRCIAGIERPDEGRIVIDGETVFDSEKRIDLPPQKRRAGLLFQSYALFPNMTVRENIRVGISGRADKAAAEAEIAQIIRAFGIEQLAAQRPHALSGGEQQRVALARILVSKPRILMLDEPFSALDGHLRFRLEQEVSDVIRGFSGTALFVSHDREEVYRMSDRVAVMAAGHVESFTDKAALFEAPKTRSAALLTGCRNISRLQRTADGGYLAADWNVPLSLSADTDAPYIGVYAHELRLDDGENAAQCRVVRVIENPFTCILMLEPVGGGCSEPLALKLDRAACRWKAGDVTTVGFPKARLLPLAK